MTNCALIHQENALTYMFLVSMASVRNHAFDLLDHPTYSPYHQLHNMNRRLTWSQYRSDAGNISAVDDIFEPAR